MLLALAGCLACTLLAACSLPTAGGFVPTGKLAGPIKDVKPLDGATITVGSKNFSENVLLGKMAIILMQSAGASVFLSNAQATRHALSLLAPASA